MNDQMIARLRQIACEQEVGESVRASAERLAHFLQERQDRAWIDWPATPTHLVPSPLVPAADADVMWAE
ncbi:MAG TPA: hypothetical protein VEA41_07140 [Salinarimonas sp.]|nr:hypothetical protein [Salinarimonas sp.]